MKKLLSLATIVFGLGIATAQQAAPSTSTASHPKTAAVVKKETKVAPAATTKKAETKPVATVKPGVKLKKDGTVDKRYKENKHLKKDGTPDKRYKANK